LPRNILNTHHAIIECPSYSHHKENIGRQCAPTGPLFSGCVLGGDGMATTSTIALLRVIARHHPELWELIHPHVPFVAVRTRFNLANRFDAVALNPQPLPPGEELVAVTRSVAGAIAEAVIAANTTGQESGGWLAEIVDDWCGTPTPHKIPWPKKWPAPWPPGEPYPIDPMIAASSIQAEAGLVFQMYAAGIEDEGLSAQFAEAGERLITTSIETQQ
jgi:hypothetical protein